MIKMSFIVTSYTKLKKFKAQNKDNGLVLERKIFLRFSYVFRVLGYV
jgi:hypothetical protein